MAYQEKSKAVVEYETEHSNWFVGCKSGSERKIIASFRYREDAVNFANILITAERSPHVITPIGYEVYPEVKLFAKKEAV